MEMYIVSLFFIYHCHGVRYLPCKFIRRRTLIPLTVPDSSGRWLQLHFIPSLTVGAGRDEREREREEESCGPIKHISCLLYGH